MIMNILIRISVIIMVIFICPIIAIILIYSIIMIMFICPIIAIIFICPIIIVCIRFSLLQSCEFSVFALKRNSFKISDSF